MMNMKQKDYPLAILPIRSILVPNLAIEILVLMQQVTCCLSMPSCHPQPQQQPLKWDQGTSPTSNPRSLWLKSMWPDRNGMSWEMLKLKPLDLHSGKPSKFLFIFPINIVVYMLEIGTLTRILLLFLIQSSKSTMALNLVLCTPLTWMPARFLEMLPQMSLCIL